MKARQFPVKVIQFGKGNFLRGFSTWMVEILNRETDFGGMVEIVETFDTRKSEQLVLQDFKYHVTERGVESDKVIERITLVQSVSGLTNPSKLVDEFLKLALEPELKFIISNTTEAGIVFKQDDNEKSQPKTFPARLTALLFHRYEHFSNSQEKIFILPCELIDNNADALKEIILKYCQLWKLSKDFTYWLDNKIVFCNTLVDRIVSGYPKAPEAFKKKMDFEDKLMVECEPFHIWAIENKGNLHHYFPVNKTELNVQFVRDIKPYKEIKVRILNGCHTAMVAIGMLNNIRTVKDFMSNQDLKLFLDDMLAYDILPTLSDYKTDAIDFRNQVFDRFENPFLEHELSTIQLNSISKFKSRLLPPLKDYLNKNGELPNYIPTVLAHLLWLYKDDKSPLGIQLKDEEHIMNIFKLAWSENNIEMAVSSLLGNENLWGENLLLIKGLWEVVIAHTDKLSNDGDF